MIRLHGGPWNGAKIPDLGKVIIRITVATAWNGKNPAVGASVGLASYEPDKTRTRAFYLETVWCGKVVAIIEN